MDDLKRAKHPTVCEAQEALSELAEGWVTPTRSKELKGVLDAVLGEWGRHLRDDNGKPTSCMEQYPLGAHCPPQRGAPARRAHCSRPKGHEGPCGPSRPGDWLPTHRCSEHLSDGRCSLCRTYMFEH